MMRRGSKQIIAYIFLCILSLCLFLPINVFASEQESNGEVKKRVLFISSYSYAWETVPEQIEGIKQALSSQAVIDYKFMDTKNINTEASRELFFQTMEEYIHTVPPYDAIIAGDDDAFNFTMEHKKDLFANIPIVFEGVNNVTNALAAEEKGMATGVIESLSYKNTIALAQDLYPNATNIVAILDNTITGQAERQEYYAMKQNFPKLQFDEINTSECTQKEVINKVETLDESTILLYILFTEDKEGHTYTSTDSVKMVSNAATIPTFSIVSTGMGYGILGGEIVSQREMGYEAAQMAQKILSGEKTTEIPVKRNSPKTFYFDEDQMERFDIAEKELPDNAWIINKKETFWTRNSELIEVALWLFIVLGLLLAIMTYDNIRRRKLNGTLVKMKDTLEEASRYDAMTGLLNRSVFIEDLETKIKNNEKFGIIMMDLDNFKSINDTLGHNNGDIVLKELASRIKIINDENFQAYRLAGDEFTAIIDSKNPEVSEAYAKEIQYSFKKPYTLDKQQYMLHSSIGIAIFPKDGETASELIASADEAMYRIKNNGKGGITFYSKNFLN